MSRLFALLLSGCFALCVVTPASAERRALVIGNDTYAHVDPLKNAVADARAMAKALEGAGFKVESPVLNADRGRLFDAIARFSEGLGQSDEAVVFFAGHAVELKGVNYLLPVDIRNDNERSVTFNAVPLNYLLSSVGDQRPKFSLVVIDACRDNPFKGDGRNLNSRGLVPAGAAVAGQMVIYSASEGQKALDRLGPDDKSPNGVFTRVFVKAIETPDIPVHEAMRRVKSEVKRLAESVQHRQLPAIYDATEGEFYFKGKGTGGAAKVPAPSRDEDAEAYEAADGADSIEALEHYLEAFPKGRYAAAARIRLAALRKATVPPPPTPVADPYPAGKEFDDCSGCPRMVVIPGGSFVMGSPSDEPNRADDEGPQRTVQVGRFALGKTEVTRGEFRRFVRDTGRSVSGCYEHDGKEWKLNSGKSWESPGIDQTDDHPVVCVDWNDAQAYAQWISRKSGQTYRLASEAEWEYAARAGSRGVRHWGNGESEACRYANVADRAGKRKYSGWTIFDCDDGYANTAPVASYRPNDFGLYDMMGNVWEWTEDCWNESYRGAPSGGSAWTSGNCSRRVVRGGAWDGKPAIVRSANRNWFGTADRYYITGFRLARTLP
jgi:formylglycine-generating enzyme required for sulfatase activity